MIKYEKKDKNGDVVFIIIDDKSMFSIINCDVYKPKRFLFFKVKTKVFTQIKNTSDIVDYTCEDFENWANNALSGYNDKLLESEKAKKILKTIKKGC